MKRRGRAVLGALALTVALPSAGLAAKPQPYVTDSEAFVATTGAVGGVQFVPLINSGEEAFGDLFEGIPDGLGVVPAPGNQGWVDIYVAHEQSHVPFGLTPTSVWADYQDSSVTRVRVDVASQQIIDMEIALPASAGFIRFCSAFMAGPEHGFPHYTFLLNEESNDVVPVLPGAPYGSDPSAPAGERQAGYAVYLDTVNGKYDALPGHGRHNHENNVIVPGGWPKSIVSLSGDDTFTSTSSAARPNLSQLYMHISDHWKSFVQDEGTLYGFRVTATHEGPVDPENALNDANDYFEILPGQTWAGEFIPVPEDVANGTTEKLPQDALEDWSNEENVFQFIRVEDVAYDPDDPRVVYFADTGNSRLWEDETAGRLFRLSSSDPRVGASRASQGRVFKMVLNAEDPRIVDAFSVLADATQVGFRSPDNLDVGHNSLMLQEDASNAKIWMHPLGTSTWTHVATATQPAAETSGILDVSEWFGAGWWALDVQSHDFNADQDEEFLTWTRSPTPPGGNQYRLRRELGQLLLMHVPGS